MGYFGCHLSASGGNAAMVKTALSIGANTFAFFTRNPRGSKAKPEDPADTAKAAAMLEENHFGKLVAHGAYTMNLCTADADARAFAAGILEDDLRRMAALPGNFYNFHPGSHVKQGAETGIALIAETLNQVLRPDQATTVLLETMAGKGTECGRNFDELATIMDGVENKANVGVTFDTCHALDAGYDLENDYDGVMRQLNEVIGLARVKAIHVNDSQFGLGSHKDRHANIGEGQLGIPFFTRLVNDPTMAKLPMILETKEQTPTTHRDEIALLRGLVD